MIINMKRVALINDLSGFGKCSLTAAIPVISVMGIQACPLPTAILSAQTGFENYYCDDFTDRMDCFTNEWKKMGVSFNGIYSGFLASALQIEKVINFLKEFETQETLYLADPVMGDNGTGYDIFSKELLAGMKRLTKRANIITPNLTELCMLADKDYDELVTHKNDADYIEQIQSICEKLAKEADREQTIMVTGIIRRKSDKEYIGTLAVSNKSNKFESYYTETLYTGKSFSGTGDLFASVICGSLIKGESVKEALDKATSFLQIAIEDASQQDIIPQHGVQFEKYLSKIM